MSHRFSEAVTNATQVGAEIGAEFEKQDIREVWGPLLLCGSCSGGLFLEKLFFAVDQGIYVVRGKLKTMPVGNGVRGARFNAVATENAAAVIDIVNAGVALSRGDAAGVGVFSSFDVDAIGRASGCAEKTSHALLEAGLVAVQNMDSAIARLKMHGLEGVILRDRLPEHVPERHAEPLHQRGECLADFSKDGCHELGV